MELERLYELLEDATQHLPPGGEPHFHVALSTNDDEWDLARFLISPPYRDRNLAEADATDPTLKAKSRGYQIDVVKCDRQCPRSSRGIFGWGDETLDYGHWWDIFGRHR
jgi:hypothetical protein